MLVSVSEIKTYWACPARWWLRYIDPKRSPRVVSNALTAGTIWHKFMEGLLSGDEREAALGEMEARFTEAIDTLNDAGLLKQAVKLGNEREIMLAGGELWNDWLECETLAVEQASTLELADVGITIQGRLDREIRLKLNGRIAHFQHKSLGASKPVAPFIETYARSPHEAVYWAMQYQKYKEEPHGVVLNIFRKLSSKSIRNDPAAALQQHVIPISHAQAMTGVINVKRTCMEMQRRIIDGYEPYNNPDMDLGFFGNSKDPFFEYFSTGDRDLLMDDSKFQDTVDRYADPEEAEA